MKFYFTSGRFYHHIRDINFGAQTRRVIFLIKFWLKSSKIPDTYVLLAIGVKQKVYFPYFRRFNPCLSYPVCPILDIFSLFVLSSRVSPGLLLIFFLVLLPYLVNQFSDVPFQLSFIYILIYRFYLHISFLTWFIIGQFTIFLQNRILIVYNDYLCSFLCIRPTTIRYHISFSYFPY